MVPVRKHTYQIWKQTPYRPISPTGAPFVQSVNFVRQIPSPVLYVYR